MFYSYKNIPVSLNGLTINASSAELSIDTQLAPNYVVNQTMDNDYNFSSSNAGRLRLTYFLTGRDYLTEYMNRDEERVISGNVAGLYFNSGYLSNYVFSAVANNPLSVNCEILFFENVKGSFSPSSSSSGISTGEVLHANSLNITTLDNATETITDFGSISWSFKSEIAPEFYARALTSVNEFTPSRVALGIREISIQFDTFSTNLNLPMSGAIVGAVINCRTPKLDTTVEYFLASGVLTSKSVSVNAGRNWGNVYSLVQHSEEYTASQTLHNLPPTITSFNPTTALVGDPVDVYGSNLGTTKLVSVGGGQEVRPYFVSDSQITFNVPEFSYTGPIYVTTRVPYATVKSLDNLTVTYPSVVISSITPTLLVKGEEATILGKGFNDSDKILYGDLECSFRYVSNTELSFTVPQYTDNQVADYVWVISSRRNVSGRSANKIAPEADVNYITPEYGASHISNIWLVGRNFSGVAGVYFSADIVGDAQDWITANILSSSVTGIYVNVPIGARNSIKVKLEPVAEDKSIIQNITKWNVFTPIAYVASGLYDADGNFNPAFNNNEFFSGYGWNLDTNILLTSVEGTNIYFTGFLANRPVRMQLIGTDQTSAQKFIGYTPTEEGFDGEVTISNPYGQSYPNVANITVNSVVKPIISNVIPIYYNFHSPMANDATIILEGTDLNSFDSDTQAVRVTGQWSGLRQLVYVKHNAAYYIGTSKFISPYGGVDGNRLTIKASGISFSGEVNDENCPFEIVCIDTNANYFENNTPTYNITNNPAYAEPDSSIIQWNVMHDNGDLIRNLPFKIEIRNNASIQYSNGLNVLLSHPHNVLTARKGNIIDAETHLKTDVKMLAPKNKTVGVVEEGVHFTVTTGEFNFLGHRAGACIYNTATHGFKISKTPVQSPYVDAMLTKVDFHTPYAVIRENWGRWTYTFDTPQSLRYIAIITQDRYHKYSNGVYSSGAACGHGNVLCITGYDKDNQVLFSNSSQLMARHNLLMRAKQGFADYDKEESNLVFKNNRYLVDYNRSVYFFNYTTGVSKIVIGNANSTLPLVLDYVSAY